MEKKIEIPERVEIKIDDKLIEISGPKGTIKKDFNNPRFNKFIKIEKKDSEVSVRTDSKKRKIRAFVGTIHAHIRNMVNGVTRGYKYEMKIVYTHFPMTVSVRGKEIEIKNFIGEKGTRKTYIVGETGVKVEKEKITLSGINVDDVSQTAANIEIVCKLSGRDKRIFTDGIYISEKSLQEEDEKKKK